MKMLVTGGSRGIGANIVVDGAKRGHDIVFTYVSDENAARDVIRLIDDIQAEGTVDYLRLDVRDSTAVAEVVEQATDLLGGIEVLVNNAGITRDGPAIAMTDEDWRDVIDTNLSGTFYLCRAVLPQMIDAGFGRIVNVSSLGHVGSSGQANYSASKAGMNGLTRTLAKEYGRKGITVNAVVPGFFETDMTRESLPQELRDFWGNYCPMPEGRPGRLSELSALVEYLISPEAAFINGQTIHATGGLDWGP
ncbi:MAG: 3-oxoacyl-ACP reductase FabG [Deltaproteobacteria bacterium]|nr:3-oxoacyl-ACP reductase FabG [Deltaproteobacteria bacterium]